MLGHGLARTEAAGYRRRASLGQGEKHVDDAFAGDQRLIGRKPAGRGAGHPYRPPLRYRYPLAKACFCRVVKNRVIAFLVEGGYIAAINAGWNHYFTYNAFRFLYRAKQQSRRRRDFFAFRESFL